MQIPILKLKIEMSEFHNTNIRISVRYISISITDICISIKISVSPKITDICFLLKEMSLFEMRYLHKMCKPQKRLPIIDYCLCVAI